MASDLISRKALLEKAWDADTRCGYVQVVDVHEIENTPTVDAVEVVHGEWIPEDVAYNGRTEKFKCSACGRVHFYGHYVHSLEYEFCPMCGAKMDGDKE